MGQFAWTYNARRAAWYMGGRGYTAKAFDSFAWDVRDEHDAVTILSNGEPASGTGVDVEDAKAQAQAAFDEVTRLTTVARE